MCYNIILSLLVEFYPHIPKGYKLLCEGMGILSTEQFRYGGMKPVIEKTEKSEGCVAVLMSNIPMLFSYYLSL